MSRSSNLLSSKARLMLFLFSCLGATAFYCNQPQSKNLLTNSGEIGINNDQTSSTPSFLKSMKTSQDQQQEEVPFSRLSSILSERNAFKGGLGFGQRRKKTGCRCPENEEHNDEGAILEDRREALFAAMGGLWAHCPIVMECGGRASLIAKIRLASVSTSTLTQRLCRALPQVSYLPTSPSHLFRTTSGQLNIANG